jgi:hypothetical protein
MKFGNKHSSVVLEHQPGAGGFFFLAVVAFMLCLPDTDAFMAERSVASSLFVLLGGDIAVEITRLYTPLVAIGLVLALPFLDWRTRKSLPFYLVIILSVATLGWIGGMDVFQGAGYLAIRSNLFLNFVIFPLSFLVCYLLANRSNWFAPVFAGIVLASLLKLAYSIYTYRTAGGIQILGGVESIQGDGGSLNIQVFVASISVLKSVEAFWKRKWKSGIFFLLLNLIFIGGLAASFRRLPLVRMAAICLGGILLMYWLIGRFKRGLLLASAAAIPLAVTLAVTAVAIFGPEQALDRLNSLSLHADSNNAMANSNDAYLDDWTAFPKVIARTLGLGVGFSGSYGVHRVIDDYETEQVPLHIGAFELWASAGIIGALFQLTVFILLPITSIYLLKRKKFWLANIPLLLASALLLLWTGIFPFGAPFFVSPQTCLLLGMGCAALISCPVFTHPRQPEDAK